MLPLEVDQVTAPQLKAISTSFSDVLIDARVYIPRSLRELEDSLRDKLFGLSISDADLVQFNDALDVMYYSTMNVRRDQLKDDIRALNPDERKQFEGIPTSYKEFATHQLEVMHILADVGIKDPRIYTVAALHDVHEDTSPHKKPTPMGWIHYEAIGEVFGHDIGEMIRFISKAKTVNDHDKKPETQLNLIRALLEYPEVVIVKMADRLHMMRTIDALSPDKQKNKAQETLDLYVRLAERLGMHDFAKELGELSLKVLYGEIEYQALLKGYQNLYPHEMLNHLRAELVSDAPIFSGIPIQDILLMRPSLFQLQRSTRKSVDTFGENDFYLTCRIHINTRDQRYGFSTYVHEVLKRCSSVKVLPAGFTFDWQTMQIPISIDRQQKYQVTLKNNIGQNLLLEFVADEYLARFEPSLLDLYRDHIPRRLDGVIPQEIVMLPMPISYKRIAQEKLVSLQANLKRLDQEKRYTKDIVEEFIVNLDQELITVFTERGIEWTFPEGATVLDYLYAVKPDIANDNVQVILEYPNGEQIPAVVYNRTLPYGVKVIIAKVQRAPIDPTFLSRLDYVQTRAAKERIAKRLRRAMQKERRLPKQLRSKKYTLLYSNKPITRAVREKGMAILEDSVGRDLISRNLWPGKLIFDASKASDFTETTKDTNRQVGLFINFLESLGLEYIVPGKRRADYLRRVVSDLIAQQNQMVRIDLLVPNQEGMSRAVSGVFTDCDFNIEYEETEVDQLRSGFSRMTKVIKLKKPQTLNELSQEDGLLYTLSTELDKHTGRILKLGRLTEFSIKD